MQTSRTYQRHRRDLLNYSSHYLVKSHLKISCIVKQTHPSPQTGSRLLNPGILHLSFVKKKILYDRLSAEAVDLRIASFCQCFAGASPNTTSQADRSAVAGDWLSRPQEALHIKIP